MNDIIAAFQAQLNIGNNTDDKATNEEEGKN
jgi:hypothetical protein